MKMCEKAIIDSRYYETPEKRANGLCTVRDALHNMINTESRESYLIHYDADSLSAILKAVEATSEERTESDAFYHALNKPLCFHLISFDLENRSKEESDILKKLIDMPSIKIYQAIKKLDG